ncbi:MAG: ABC transporter ATP-binding protein/permease [Crocinitomicaceae bacterium]|jgi:ATP-binding cassette, subfamily B, multidrug efflux pump|nr:ABC transporter ATP-binding protein/permease [Crocinitomicaceae bacterium]MDP4738896.1 ABC transporter ATP-binding protein/permease [Crocinitomicaceae bacterium]MDP4798996.1 ABC transporter ATP-binding protein/permease [Crocinitomicaceae bacterium]MDP4868812.1 ABC transporter ATP-binding protein/permease [Crocinitomicaceae bacterium]MDP4955653.1 ABC transporter ATP-binding protein/permease [Crocinitomicaceae bacterium]
MKSLRYINKYFIKYKWRFLLGILFTVVSNYFGVQMPAFFSDSIDQFQSQLASKEPTNYLWLALELGAIYMGFSLLKGFFLFLMRQTIIVMSRYIEFDLKKEIYDQYQALDQSFYKRNATGDLMNRISEDVGLVRMYAGPGMMYTINLAVSFILIVGKMISISPSLTVYVLLPLPLMSILIYKVSSTMNKMSLEVQKEQSFLSTLAQESFSGIRIIKAYQREEQTTEKVSESAERYKKQSMRLVLVNAFFSPTIIFLIGLSSMIAIYYGGLLTFEKKMTVGGIVAFIMYVTNLTWPFASLGWISSIIQRAAASQQRLNEFLLRKPKIKNDSDLACPLEEGLVFEQVNFSYPESDSVVLKDVNFSVHKGETLAIIGPTGSGKSTICALLARHFDPSNGQISIADRALPLYSLNAYRHQIALVPQDVFLFSDTIANNLKFGVEQQDLSRADLEAACKKAHVLHNIQGFQDGFETILGERGVNLSGGQKQRVSIARALLRDPKLLILDDCLSAVDTETEEIILEELQKDAQNRATIIVSHRISSIRNATKIIVLEEGSVIEAGTHETLLAQKGAYYDMYQFQLEQELQAKNS